MASASPAGLGKYKLSTGALDTLSSKTNSKATAEVESLRRSRMINKISLNVCKLFFLVVSAIEVYADNELGVMHSLHTAYPDWTPRGVVDVGANTGGWTTAMQGLYPGVKTFMVEASPTHTTELETTKTKFGTNVVDYQIAVLSSTDGDTVNFFSLEGGGTGNSLFAEQSKHYKDIKPEVRTTSKLDTLVNDIEHIDYLKLDVQGAELIVLSGGNQNVEENNIRTT